MSDAPYGYRKDGQPKQKPGPKRGTRRKAAVGTGITLNIYGSIWNEDALVQAIGRARRRRRDGR